MLGDSSHTKDECERCVALFNELFMKVRRETPYMLETCFGPFRFFPFPRFSSARLLLLLPKRMTPAGVLPCQETAEIAAIL